MLERLILSITSCIIDKALIGVVDIIIVDNDKEKTAKIIIEKLNQICSQTFQIYYYDYPIKGLSNVRNELIKYSILLKPDFIIFIDDDEYVSVDWLTELVKTMVIKNADAARGPVIPVLDPPISKYISHWFSDEEHHGDDELLTTLFTGNLIVRRSSLEKYNILFDSRFNLSGSEDIYFGIQILKQGARLYWASKAIAYETIPERKANLTWLIKRSYRGASTHTYILKVEKKHIQLLKKMIVSIIYIITGSLATILVFIPIRKKYWGILKFSEGIGGFSGFSNILYEEYK